MTGTMRVDTDGLRAAEPALRHLSTSVGTVLTRLAGVLDAAGCCWGNDQIGASFAESYVPGARLVRDALPSLRDDVAQVGRAIVAVADNVDVAENRAQTRLNAAG
jgi:hypothetical protein